MSKVLFPSLVVICLVGVSVFTGSRYAEFDAARAQLEESRELLQEARGLANNHPEAYGPNASGGTKLDLKQLVQESGAKNGISILYLSETERDAGESVRERNVLTRTVNVPHSQLIAFMADLEARGGGARIKEIRIKPKGDKADTYQEAEIVLAVRWLLEKPAPKEASKEAAK